METFHDPPLSDSYLAERSMHDAGRGVSGGGMVLTPLSAGERDVVMRRVVEAASVFLTAFRSSCS